MNEQAKRLERLSPRLEASLRSRRSLLGERRWDTAESQSWVTHQRIQAAAAAYWIGRLLVNPGLRKTADTWLDEALKRQDVTGLFPAGFPVTSRAAQKAQGEALEALQGLAWSDVQYGLKLRGPLERGFRWFESVGKSQTANAAVGTSPVVFATYAAWTGDSRARQRANSLATRSSRESRPDSRGARKPRSSPR
jgi:hypothetical protein